MKKESVSLLAITNLFPVPWAPHRASFNQQQFALLAEQFPFRIMILVPWLEWLKHRKECSNNTERCYVPYFYLPRLGRRLTPYFQAISLWLKRKWIKQSNPSHIIASWAYPDAIACLMLADKFNAKVLVKAHGTDVNENTEFPARRKQMAHWLNRSQTVFCASKALADKLIATGIDPAKICVNYNGVNPNIFFPATTEQQTADIIFIGNLLTTKGVYELLDAYKQSQANSLNEHFPALHYIGQGPEKQKIAERIQALGLEKQVFLHGVLPLKEVAERLRTAKLLILPSYREGVPNVVLEALASGVPAIATNVGGIPEVVSEETGILVPVKDSTALSAAIDKALQHPWSKTALLEHAKQFSWPKNIGTFISRMNLDA
ncbi:glycosyltransferase [Alishewanella sp. 16-MA]|uniref:Glycosyltransferase n=1 Tax=Alishewanella maricola TaxID=2795740 RepID=A0ABS8C311_9ALTE|nr:glycosyltransferase [Alishewanella maricola]MCB5226728.1 glycosyltransferase [Alishewanella maricola]